MGNKFPRPTTQVFIMDTIDDVIANHYNSLEHNVQIIIMTREENVDNCPICCETLLENEPLKTECGHTYHKECIVTWLRSGIGQRRFKCPVCVQNLGLDNTVTV